VVKPITRLLGQEAITNEVHIACGILDSNSYDITFGDVRARGLYAKISNMNHSCSPNTWKFFDNEKNMCVVAARSIEAQEEVFLSYTPLLMATPLRQVR
jgi:hypothetical protein